MFIGSANRLTRTENMSLALALELRAATLDSRLTFSRASAATDLIDGLVVGFANDIPRISLSNGLLMEESRTNIARYSETLDNSPWTFNFTRAGRSSITGLNPRGISATLPVLVEDTQTGSHEWRPPFSVSASTSYTGSCFVKPAGRSFISLTFQAAGTPTLSSTAVFDIQNGTIVSAGTLQPTLTPCANGWYRLSITGTTGAGASTLELKIGLYSTSTTSSYTGDGVSGVMVWGTQLEAGAFASSYIPTTTASVTRALEACSMAIGNWYNEAEGTLLAEALCGSGYDSAASINNRLLRLDNNSNTAVHEMRRNNADNTSRLSTVASNVAQSSLATGTWGNTAIIRMAYAYKASDMAGCLNGGTVQTDITSPEGMPTGLTHLRIGSAISSGAFGGYVRNIKYWRTRLANDQLEAMTS